MNNYFKILNFTIFLSVFLFSVDLIHEGFAQTEKNVPIIENSEKGWWSNDNSKQLRIEEIQSIGVLEGDKDYIFAGIKDVAIDKNGNIVVCDYNDRCIKVFDKTGKFRFRIGRKGQGPGEFLNNVYIEINNTGKLFVLDFISNRPITKFDFDGNFLKSYPYDAAKYGSVIHVDCEGFVYTNSRYGIPMLTKYRFSFE